jgi:hypothetical protein
MTGAQIYFTDTWSLNIEEHLTQLQDPRHKRLLLDRLKMNVSTLPNGWLRIYENDQNFRLIVLGLTPHLSHQTNILWGFLPLKKKLRITYKPEFRS